MVSRSIVHSSSTDEFLCRSLHQSLFRAFFALNFFLPNNVPALSHAGMIADTRQHDSINKMARSHCDNATGALVPVGLSMGGYVALEMARLAPERMAGMALLSTNAGVDNEAAAMSVAKQSNLLP